MGFDDFEPMGLKCVLVGLKAEWRIVKESVIEELLSIGADIWFRFDQVVKDHYTARLQDSEGFF